jgi:hypothetical protein
MKIPNFRLLEQLVRVGRRVENSAIFEFSAAVLFYNRPMSTDYKQHSISRIPIASLVAN